MREYIPGLESERFEDFVISLSVPKFLPNDPREFFTGSVNQIMGIRGAEGDTSLYAYQYFRLGQDQIQAAWTKWSYPSVEDIQGAGFVDDVLYLLTKRNGETYLEKVPFGVGRTDTGEDFAIRLDLLSSAVSGTYDRNGDTTAYSTLFSIPADAELSAVVTSSGNPALPYGSELPVTVTSTGFPGTFRVNGDTTGVQVSVGFKYTASLTLSKALSKGDFRDGRAALLGGSAMVRDVTVYLANSGYQKATVDYADSTQSEEEFVDNVLGVSNFDQKILRDGEMKIPIHSDPEEFRVTLENDSPLPSTVVSAAWAIRYRNKHRLG